MKTLNNILKSIRSTSGASLAEFATVSALMATLAATAAPKLSEMSEGTKAEKSMSEIDKIITQASNFYQATADTEGRGRFPGQEKYNMAVGSYGGELLISAGNVQNAKDAETALGLAVTDLESFVSYDNAIASKWASVFGTTNASYPSGASVTDDEYYECDDCSASDESYGKTGSMEFIQLFNGNSLNSRFQDGHFIYVVIPGGGSGYGSFPPVLLVADLENPSDFNNSLEP